MSPILKIAIRPLLFLISILTVQQIVLAQPSRPGAIQAPPRQAPLSAFTPPPFIGLGDSLGEGVQSFDSSFPTQLNSYLNFIAGQMKVAFPLPLIWTTPLSLIESVTARGRFDPTLAASNLAVSGATTGSVLTDIAGTPVLTETDLVLQPRKGSQISIAESLRSPFIVCWVGNSDVLGTVTHFDQLNGTQYTPVVTFNANYDQIASRLGALGSKVVFATVPDVTQVALLLSPQDLRTFLGSDYGLPAGSYTSAVAMLLIKLGLNDGSILKDPNWVLDAGEVQNVHNVVLAYNQSIVAHAAKINAAVVDVNTLFGAYVQTPPVVGGVTLTRRYLGGLFSLDGVHPSDIGHALLANAFIQEIDSFYKLSIPQMTAAQLNNVLASDPFVDFNHNLKVPGRFGFGLLETLGPFLGISGDTQDVFKASSTAINAAAGKRLMQQYFALTGRNVNSTWTQQDAIDAFHMIFDFPKSH